MLRWDKFLAAASARRPYLWMCGRPAASPRLRRAQLSSLAAVRPALQPAGNVW
jgi:hypothetical protein